MPNKHSSMQPISTNPNRYVVLIDTIPSVGKLNGFFQIEFGNRTVNGFTTNSAAYVLSFLKKAHQNIHQLASNSAKLPSHIRYRFCVVNRLGQGATLDWNTFQLLASEAMLEKVTEHFQDGMSLDNRLGTYNISRERSLQIVNALPFKARPQLTLLDGLRPTVLLTKFGRWQLRSPEEDMSYRLKVDMPRMQVARDYALDQSVPESARRSVWRAHEIVSEVYQASRSKIIDRALEKLAATKTNDKIGDPQAQLGAISGYRNLVERALRRLETSQIASGDDFEANNRPVGMPPNMRYVPTYISPRDSLIDNIVNRVLSSRVNIMDNAAVLEAVVKYFLDDALGDKDMIFREVKLAEPGKKRHFVSPSDRQYLVKLSRALGPVAQPNETLKGNVYPSAGRSIDTQTGIAVEVVIAPVRDINAA